MTKNLVGASEYIDNKYTVSSLYFTPRPVIRDWMQRPIGKGIPVNYHRLLGYLGIIVPPGPCLMASLSWN